MSIEAMKQALEALTHKKWFLIGLGEPNDPKVEAAITALRTAIAEAEKQEPVAWMTGEGRIERHESLFGRGETIRPLYTTPPAQPAPVQEPTVEENSQDWAGMSGRDAFFLIQRHADGWDDVTKMMGEWLAANTPPAQPVQPVPAQEPVMWISAVTGDVTTQDMSHTVSWAPLCKCTTPPAAQRQHVTDGSLCWCDPETSYTDPETGASVVVHKGPQ